MKIKKQLIPVVILSLNFLFLCAQNNDLHHPDIPFMDKLVLLEEIDCSVEDHDFHTNGSTEIQTILGKECRVLIPASVSKYFYYRIGADVDLEAGKAYFLEIEYPDDVDRNFVVQNRGGEYSRGIQTGKTLGDGWDPPYVQSNPESISLPHSNKYIKWQTLFWVHEHYAGLELPRAQGSRPETPDDGFLVIICQYEIQNSPLNQGAAVSAIRLYEAPDFETLKMEINYPPDNLPRRHLFFREEMSDGMVGDSPPVVSNTTDWFEYKAQLMNFLGMNTYSKDLLEFGHNQGWDPGPYAQLVYTPAWKDRWENILTMLGDYDLDVMPYYEYAGTIGSSGLGPQQRAHPLNDDLPDFDYTHISWTEDVNADITDPDTYDDLKKVLERTIVRHKDKVNFTGAWIRPRSSQNPISFADEALNRFMTEANDSVPVTRDQLKSNKPLYDKYLTWWFGKRKDFLLAMRDYLRGEGVNDSAVILYTADYTESGSTHYDWGYNHNVITDDKATWWGLGYPAYDLNPYIANNWHLQAQLLPENTWGDWEWHHAAPAPDPVRYKDENGVLLTYTFNKAYTVGSETAFDAFRTKTGLAIIRHYCLNENGMDGMGYFATDIEWHGHYTMLAEARALANGDPRYIGYLATSNFNRGSIANVRDFNANFLALPALPSLIVENASDDPEIVVRKIETTEYGTYVAIVNTGFEDKYEKTIQLPSTGDVADAKNGKIILSDASEITLDMFPAQLKSLIIYPATGKLSQTIEIENIPDKNSDNEPFQVNATASSGLQVNWKVISGPATISGDMLTIIGMGLITLEAEQTGNENYYPVSETIFVRVNAPKVSTQPHESPPSFNIYPNPSRNSVFFSIREPSRFGIYSTTGTKVLELEMNHSTSVNLSHLPPGIYIVESANLNNKCIQRLIKTN